MILVLKPGMLTTVQDNGRKDYLAFGMPQAGVMDRYAARMANLLCGNPLSAAVLEMTVTGGAFRFEQACRIAVCGAAMPVLINEKFVKSWTAIDIEQGDTLEVGLVTEGCRSYLAVSGGLDVPVVMGSRSTYFHAAIGGIEGRPLRAGDKIAIAEAMPIQTQPVSIPRKYIPQYSKEIQLRVVLGPQDDLFTQPGIDTFFGSEFVITNEADRMGYRTEGAPIEHKDKADIVSDALVPGSIQVPGNGQPIIMMMDCGTTGGYAKIATVISPDLWKIAQAKPQDRIRFLACSDEDAIRALTEEQERYFNVAGLVAKGLELKEESENIPKQAAPIQKTSAKKWRVHISGRAYNVEIEEVK